MFLKLLSGQVAINGQPLHYLYRAVRNTALNHRRSQSRQLALTSNGHWLESPPGFEEIGLTLQHAEEIKAFEAKHRKARPWLFA